MKNKLFYLLMIFTLNTPLNAKKNGLDLVLKNYPARSYSISPKAKSMPFITGLGTMLVAYALNNDLPHSMRTSFSLSTGTIAGTTTALMIWLRKRFKEAAEPAYQADNKEYQKLLNLVLDNPYAHAVVIHKFSYYKYQFINAHKDLSALKSFLASIISKIQDKEQNKANVHYTSTINALTQNLTAVEKVLKYIENSPEWYDERAILAEERKKAEMKNRINSLEREVWCLQMNQHAHAHNCQCNSKKPDITNRYYFTPSYY